MSHARDLGGLLIRRHEKLMHLAYDDATGKVLRPGMTLIGHPTVGYGRALDVKGISEHEAELLLAPDLADAEAIAIRLAGAAWPELDVVRKAVLVDMAHNLGNGLAVSWPGLRAAIRRHDYPAAAASMVASRWYGQVGGRAVRLVTMMRTGCWPDEIPQS